MFRFVQNSSKWPKHKHTLEKNWHAVDMHRLQDCSFLKPEDPKLLFSTRGVFLLLFQKFYFETKVKDRQRHLCLTIPKNRTVQNKKCLRRSLIFKALTSKKSKKKCGQVLPVKQCPNTKKESNEKCVAQGQVQWKGARKQLAVFTSFGTQPKLHEQRS